MSEAITVYIFYGIAAGILAGPSALDIAHSQDQIDRSPNWESQSCCFW